jgi:hypothetical protein
MIALGALADSLKKIDYGRFSGAWVISKVASPLQEMVPHPFACESQEPHSHTLFKFGSDIFRLEAVQSQKSNPRALLRLAFLSGRDAREKEIPNLDGHNGLRVLRNDYHEVQCIQI